MNNKDQIIMYIRVYYIMNLLYIPQRYDRNCGLGGVGGL